MRNHSIRVACLAIAVASLALAACSPKHQEQAAAPEPALAPASAPSAVAVVPQEERKCTNEPRTDENDKRSRCVGMGTVPPVSSHAYRIILDNGEYFTTCDITKPFSGKIGGGMITLSFTPTDDKSGSMAFHFANGRGIADTAYSYTLSGPEEKMTGSFRSNSAICGKAAGLGGCAVARMQAFTSTWTRIEDCGK